MIRTDFGFRSRKLVEKCGFTDTRESHQSDGCVSRFLDIESFGVSFGRLSFFVFLLKAGDLRFEFTDMTFGSLVVLGLGDLFLELSYLILNRRTTPSSDIVDICALFKGNAEQNHGKVIDFCVQ